MLEPCGLIPRRVCFGLKLDFLFLDFSLEVRLGLSTAECEFRMVI